MKKPSCATGALDSIPQKHNLKFPIILITFFYVFGAIMWLYTKNTFFLFDLPFIGTSIFIGIMLSEFLSKRSKFWGRITTQFLIGTYMVLFIGLRMKVNMQIEMFFFLIFSWTFGGAIVHYLPAKVVGPILFNRGWCGWGCWTASILDLFPWKKKLPGRIRNLGIGRYIHLALIITLTAILWFAYGYKPRQGRPDVVLWFCIGNMLYYISGIVLAIMLKDNRAFCKYLCPIPPIQKILGRFSLFKITVNKTTCIHCGACDISCPMDLKIQEYIAEENGKINSTECILCSVCQQVCPKKAIALKVCPTVCTKERLYYRA
jgi:ferredoxin-type protein NapH